MIKWDFINNHMSENNYCVMPNCIGMASRRLSFDENDRTIDICHNCFYKYYVDLGNKTCEVRKAYIPEQPESLKPDEIVEPPKMIHSTMVEVKQEFWSMFAKLIENQFNHGGDKYAMSHPDDIEFMDEAEMTDIICQMFPGRSGVDWALGTIVKYAGRFSNFRREKDLLKIVTFAYIIWLKYGFQFEQEHDEDIRKEG